MHHGGRRAEGQCETDFPLLALHCVRTMDHSEAIRTQAAVKYVLGELPEQLRDEYEEHYFDCAICAVDVKATAAFLDNARETLRDLDRKEAPSEVAARVRPGRFAWFRPAFAVPVFAVLLLFVGYQNFVTIPQVKNSALKAGVQASNTFSLLRANARGAQGVTVDIRPTEGFALTDIDIPPAPGFDSYVVQLVDASGRPLFQTKISANQAKRSVQLAVPAGTVPGPGVYSAVVTGDPGGRGQVVAQNEVLRLSFTVAFLP